MNKTFKMYIEVFLLIMVSFSPLLSQPVKAAIILVLVIANIRYAKKMNKRKATILALFMFIFITSLALDLRNVNSVNEINILHLYFILCFCLGFLFSQKYRIDDYLYCVEKIVFLTAIFSIIGVCIYTFLPSLVDRLPSYNYYHTSHKTALFFNILTTDGGVLARNAGIAWEPGAFQFLLNLGLYSYVRYNNKANLLKIAIYFIAIFFTKSTAGLIIFVLITFKILKNDKKGRLLILICAMLFGRQIIEEVIYQFRYKLFGSFSFQIRLEPLLNAFNTGKNYFFGMGNSGFDLYYRDTTTPPWDSFGQIFIRYGYVMFFFIIYRLITLFKDYRILFFILIVTFFSQNIWFFPLITPLYFLGIDYEKLDKKVSVKIENSMVS